MLVACAGATANDGAWLRMFDPHSMGQRRSLKLAGEPNGTMLTLWPCVYHAVGTSIRHVDLNSGLLETMAEVGPGAVPGVVVNG